MLIRVDLEIIQEAVSGTFCFKRIRMRFVDLKFDHKFLTFFLWFQLARRQQSIYPQI